MVMDNLDYRLVAMLQESATTPYVEMARQLGVSEGTVRRRIANLVENRMIQIVAVTDLERIGYASTTVLHLKVDLPHLKEVVDKLCAMPAVRFVAHMGGPYNLMAQVQFRSASEIVGFLTDQLSVLPGITEVVQAPVLQIAKRIYNVGVPALGPDIDPVM